jgi:hypothetical protein
MMRDILGFVLALGFAAYLLSFVVEGIRSGRIQHTDSTSTFSFRKQPIRFILVAVLFGAFGAILLYAAYGRAMAIVHRMAA